MSDLYLGLDQGGSGSKGVLVDSSGKIHWQDTVSISTQELTGGKVEQSPEEILRSLEELIVKAKNHAGAGSITGAGLSIQRSGVLAWDKLGKPSTPLLTWRDARVMETVEKLRSKEKEISQISGLPLSYNFAAAKIALLQKEYPNLRVGTLNSWLVSTLTETSDFITEESHAARSQLYSIPERKWSEALCQLFGVEIARLPEIKPSFSELGLIHNIPLVSVLGDQQAALFGITSDTPILNIGTLAQVIVNLRNKPRYESGYNCGVTFSSPSGAIGFQMEASCNLSGATFEELRNRGIYKSELKQIDEIISNCMDEAGVIFYPYLNPGAPDWRTDLPTLLYDKINNSGEFTRALIENMAFWIALNIQELRSRGIIPVGQTALLAIGGGSEVRSLIRTISAAAGIEVRCLKNPQGSAFGGAAGAYYSLTGTHLPNDSSKNFDSIRVVDEEISERFRIWLEMRQAALNKNFGSYKKIDLTAI